MKWSIIFYQKVYAVMRHELLDSTPPKFLLSVPEKQILFLDSPDLSVRNNPQPILKLDKSQGKGDDSERKFSN